MSEPTSTTEESPMGQVGAVLWDMSPDMFAVAGPTGYLTAVNPSWQRVLGYTAQELTSRPFVDFIHPDDVDRTMGEVGALVDITGVPTIDTQTAQQHLIEAITAVRLLGAQVVLTGVRPAIAQTLVHLGVDLSGITTRSSMSAGLKVALAALSLRVVDDDFRKTST